MDNQNQEHTSFNDKPEKKIKKPLESDQVNPREKEEHKRMSEAEKEVRENEDASLQDDSYSFDEANTDDEEYHDAGDESDFDLDNDDDFVH